MLDSDGPAPSPAGDFDGDIYDAMQAHPRFDAAARALATNMLAASAADPALDGVFKDAGRYVAALLAIWLHLSGGLTLPQLKQYGTESGFFSAGRARALLLYLRYLGYVEAVADTRPTLYRPSARFQTAWRSHLAAALQAVAVLEPSIAALLPHMARPEIADHFARRHCAALQGLMEGPSRSAELDRIFLHRHAGSQIIWAMAVADERAFPPQALMVFSLSAHAARFKVSRIHLRRLIGDAQRHGLLVREGDNQLRWTDTGRAQLRFLYAGQLHGLVQAAEETERHLAEWPAA